MAPGACLPQHTAFPKALGFFFPLWEGQKRNVDNTSGLALLGELGATRRMLNFSLISLHMELIAVPTHTPSCPAAAKRLLWDSTSPRGSRPPEGTTSFPGLFVLGLRSSGLKLSTLPGLRGYLSKVRLVRLKKG